MDNIEEKNSTSEITALIFGIFSLIILIPQILILSLGSPVGISGSFFYIFIFLGPILSIIGLILSKKNFKKGSDRKWIFIVNLISVMLWGLIILFLGYWVIKTL